jgi:hypothetical protein
VVSNGCCLRCYQPKHEWLCALHLLLPLLLLLLLQGLMTARYIPNGQGQFLITAGHGVLYILDAVAETVTPVFDFQIGQGHCVLSSPFKSASRVLVSFYETDQAGAACSSNMRLSALQWLRIALPGL